VKTSKAFLYLVVGILFWTSALGAQKPLLADAQAQPYTYIHDSVSVHIQLHNPIAFFRDLEAFIKKGVGPFGVMGWQHLRNQSQSALQEDLFTPIGQYMLGLEAGQPWMFSVFQNNDQKTTPGKKAFLAVFIPVRDQKLFENFLYKRFLEKKSAGKFEIKSLSPSDHPYIQAGSFFMYTFVDGYAVISDNEKSLQLALEARKGQKNLFNKADFQKTISETDGYGITLYLDPQATGSMLDSVGGLYGRKPMLNPTDAVSPVPPLNQKAFAYYHKLIYGIQIDGNGLKLKGLSEMGSQEKVKALLNFYQSIEDRKELDPQLFLSRHPLFFLETGFDGEALYTFLMDYLNDLGILKDKELKVKEKIAAINKKHNVDLEKDFIFNLTTPGQLMVWDIATPITRDNFLQGNSFLAIGIKDKAAIQKVIQKFQAYLENRIAEKKKNNPEYKDTDEKGQLIKINDNEWSFIVRENIDKQGKAKEIRFKLLLTDSMMYLGLADFSLTELTKLLQNKDHKFSKENFLLGIQEAGREEYGFVAAVGYFDFKKLTLLLKDYQSNMILGQVLMVLKNYDSLVTVSKVKDRSIRSWVEIRLKK